MVKAMTDLTQHNTLLSASTPYPTVSPASAGQQHLATTESHSIGDLDKCQLSASMPVSFLAEGTFFP